MHPSSIKEFYSGKSIFITGATGFIGKVFICVFFWVSTEMFFKLRCFFNVHIFNIFLFFSFIYILCAFLCIQFYIYFMFIFNYKFFKCLNISMNISMSMFLSMTQWDSIKITIKILIIQRNSCIHVLIYSRVNIFTY